MVVKRIQMGYGLLEYQSMVDTSDGGIALYGLLNYQWFKYVRQCYCGYIGVIIMGKHVRNLSNYINYECMQSYDIIA